MRFRRATRPRVLGYRQKLKERQRLGRELRQKAALQLTGAKLRQVKFQTKVGPFIKVGVGVVLVLVIYFIFFSNFFMLDNLKITGTHLLEPEEVQHVLFPKGFTKVNAITFMEGLAKRKLLKQNQIADVAFSKNLISNTLTVEVTEHQTSIIWQTGGQQFLVNRFGVVYDEAEPGSPLLVVEDLKNVPISLSQKIVTTEFIDFVTSFAANLPRRTNITIRRITVPETTFEVEMETKDGWRIILDTTASWEEQLNNLVRVLREMPDQPPSEYIDLRVGKRVYYK
ncbi:MAG: cell division protein FtsQ/DivIB [Patescibacteria group bacterium]|nr:cell division protein FtsQ/DivIB [Patescibacteria group bacterium]